MEVADLLGYCAAAASLVAFSARTMIPLRVAAIVSNVLFISYGVVGSHGPPIVLHTILLPLNVHRLVAMRRLIHRVKQVSDSHDFNVSWLQPYMKKKAFRAGDIIFCRGDVSREVYYLTSGRIRFPEVDRTAEGGLLFGEIAMFTPGGTRTLSCLCETDVEVLYITNDELKQLYFQNPEFGFHLVRLIVGRLVNQVHTLERDRIAGTPDARARQEMTPQTRTGRGDSPAWAPSVRTRSGDRVAEAEAARRGEAFDQAAAGFVTSITRRDEGNTHS